MVSLHGHPSTEVGILSLHAINVALHFALLAQLSSLYLYSLGSSCHACHVPDPSYISASHPFWLFCQDMFQFSGAVAKTSISTSGNHPPSLSPVR